MIQARIVVCSLVFCGLLPRGVAAQNAVSGGGTAAPVNDSIVIIPHLSGPVQLDGVIDEEAWLSVEPLEVTMYLPIFEGELTERTEIRIAHDGTYLYVSGRMFDSDPSGIRANSLNRDRYSGDDALALVLDTFNDNENGLWFVTTPEGVRLDMTISNDAEFGSGPPVNDSWNTFWDSAASRDENGWYVEVRIPFSSLGFQDEGGRVTMGLITYRFIARKNELQIYPAIPPNWDMGHIKPSAGQRVILEGVRSRNPVYITPYLLGGLSHNRAVRGMPAPAGASLDRNSEAGLDLRYKLTNNLALNLTLNTDFAQVEADDQMVNLSRFSLFFPEKRQFFQERASIFGFSTVGMGQLFYSRRIGLTDSGEPVRILGGGRLVGRMGNWDIGVIDMQTDEVASLPAENLGVVRLRRQVFNPYSYAGGMLTSRLGTDGSYNLAYGLDSVIRLFGEEYLTLKWAQTFDRESIRSAGYRPLESGFLMAQWQKRRMRGLSYIITTAWNGSGFDPGLGFSQRNDFHFMNTLIRYRRLAPEESPLRTWGTNIFGSAFVRNGDGQLETGMLQFMMNCEFKNGIFAWCGLIGQHEDIVESYSFSDDAEVPAGTYRYTDLMIGCRFPETSLLQPVLFFRTGQFFDGRWTWCNSILTWRLSRHLEMAGEYELNLIRFPDRGQEFTAHLGRLRLRAALNTRLSANTFLQYNSANDLICLNGQFRYFISEGNDLWLVINDMRNIDPYMPLDPDCDYCGTRTLIFKYTYTFIR